jgi:hypothetical protein
MDDPGAQLSRSHGGDDKKLQEMLVKLYELYICRISFKERWNSAVANRWNPLEITNADGIHSNTYNFQSQEGV